MKSNLSYLPKTSNLPALAGAICVAAMLSACDSDSGAVIGDLENQTTETTDGDGTGAPDPDDGTGTETEGETGEPAEPDGTTENNTEFEAKYQVNFSATWSADTHPTNFPGDPHFSPLTGAVHSEQSIIWEIGGIATPGIEEMAESGSPSILLAEIQSVIAEGRATATIEGGGIPTAPGNVLAEFTVNRDYPLVTLVSMLAPSPDWFIGISGQNMIDQDGNFVPDLTIDLELYDSGTDSGTTFVSEDVNTDPKDGIGLVNSFPSDSDFLNGLPIVGHLFIERIQ